MIKEIIFTLVMCVIIFILFWKFWFLRNPNRHIPEGKSIISPADGKVIEIIKFDKNNLLNMKNEPLTINKGLLGKIKTTTADVSDSGYIVSIFMSPFDVHYNRMPIDGEILSVVHTSGKFLPVMTFEHGLLNEKNEILLSSYVGKIKVIQIAGFLARRISSFVNPKENIKKGQIIGLINLGSQLTIILPSNVKVNVTLNQKVKAGESVIATY